MTRLGHLVLVVAIMVSLGVTTGVAGQDATPAAEPVTPQSEACILAARSREEVVALGGEPPRAGTFGTPGPATVEASAPAAFAPSEPADGAAVAGITATLQQWLACYNAGEPLRMYALATDSMIRQQFVEPEDLDRTGPIPADEQGKLVGVFYAREYPDGRVGAIVAVADPTSPAPVDPIFLVFVRDGDRWLLDVLPEGGGGDGEFDEPLILPATPVVATPVS